MSIREVKITNKTKQLGELLSIAYDNLTLLTNNIALYTSYKEEFSLNTTKVLVFNEKGDVYDNLRVRVEDYARVSYYTEENMQAQVIWLYNEVTKQDTTVIRLINNKTYLCSNSFLVFERKHDLLFGHSLIKQTDIRCRISLSFILINLNSLEVTVIEKVKEPPCLPTASSFIIQVLTVDSKVYGFNREGKLHRQENGSWIQITS